MEPAFFDECLSVLKLAQGEPMGNEGVAAGLGAGLGALALGGATMLGRRRLSAAPAQAAASQAAHAFGNARTIAAPLARRAASSTIGNAKTIAAPLAKRAPANVGNASSAVTVARKPQTSFGDMATVAKPLGAPPPSKSMSPTLIENKQVEDLMSGLTPAEHAALEGSSLVRKGASKASAAQLALLSKGQNESLTDFLSRAASAKLAAEKVVGGKGDGKTDDDFEADQVAMGHKVELEHTGDPEIAAEITRDHLVEFPDYYTRLKRMENAAKQDDTDDQAIKAAEAIAYDMASKEAQAFLLELVEITKQANFPTGPSSLKLPNDPTKQLAKAQKVGTPDDPAGPKFKPLNMLKPPSTSTAPVASVAKVAFAGFGFGPTGGVWRPRYASVVQPVGAPPLGAFDPQLKEGGSKLMELDKRAFSSSGFGAARSTGYGTHGNAGFHASIVQPLGAPPLGARDPQLKEAASKYKKALMTKSVNTPVTPAGRLASARNEGAPKKTAPSGPSISDISKPVGFGHALPGTKKNII